MGVCEHTVETDFCVFQSHPQEVSNVHGRGFGKSKRSALCIAPLDWTSLGGGGGGGSGDGKVSLPTVGMPERDDRNGSPRHQGSGLAQHDQERYRSSSQSPSRRRYRPTSSLGQGRSDDNTHIAGVTSSHGGKCQHHHHEDHGKMAAGGSHHAFRRDLHRSALRCIPTTKTPPATPFAPGLPPCSPPQLGDRADAHSHNEAQHTGCFFPQHRTISAHPNNSAVSSAGPWTRGCARQAPSSLPSSGEQAGGWSLLMHTD